MSGISSGTLPDDAGRTTLVGRVFDPAEDGPCVVAVRGDRVVDLTAVSPTMSELLDRRDVLDIARTAPGRRDWALDEVLSATEAGESGVRFLSPVDLQVIKAAGVTFAASMVERVIEEKTSGDPSKALDVRARIVSALDDAVGGSIGAVKPGSPEAAEVKRILIEGGLWSQYLEVGLGPDPEIFTKAPVLSSVGTGAAIGVLERSTWNNPEPEVVLAVTSGGVAVGATLGNDVNLRDFEGRSALLLSEAKDNNASCAIGPVIRLFDENFDLEAVKELEIGLTVRGRDGYFLEDTSSMRQMSRELRDLISHAYGSHHRYPDGFVLFTGTLFAPTQDRDVPGMGFTHRSGDRVTISAPSLGSLTNEVTTAESAADWTFGIRALIENLAGRSLLTPRTETRGQHP